MDANGRVSVSTTVAAPPDVVHAMVSDVTRMGEWSPECVRCDWLDAGRSTFEGHNRRGARRWSTKGEVVANEPGREFTFDVTSVFGLPVARWSYTFAPAGDGATSITESWEDRRGALIKTLGLLATGVRERAEHNRAGMEQTLARIKVAAEAR